MSIVDGTKSVKDAAAIIGVTDRSLRRWINNFYERGPSGKGKPQGFECTAVKVEADIFPAGFVWQVPADEIERLRGQEKTGAGRPRLSETD